MLVVQFGLGSLIDNPVISIIPSVTQYSPNIVFYTPNTVRGDHYISVTMTQHDTILMDGRIEDVTWYPVFDETRTAVGYTAIITNILPNIDHTIATENNHSLSVTVFGFDRDTSYCYNVGSDVMEQVLPTNTMDVDCSDGMYSFSGLCVNCQTEQDDPACRIGKCRRAYHTIVVLFLVPFGVFFTKDSPYIIGASVLARFHSNKTWIVALCRLFDGLHYTDYIDCKLTLTFLLFSIFYVPCQVQQEL